MFFSSQQIYLYVPTHGNNLSPIISIYQLIFNYFNYPTHISNVYLKFLINFELIFNWFIKYVLCHMLLHQKLDIYFGPYVLGIILPSTM